MNIFDYELYLFDFDGTIVDTEQLHYTAYKKAFEDINSQFEFSYVDYCRYKHGDDTTYINNSFTIDEIKSVSKKKDAYFHAILSSTPIGFIAGFEAFLNLLFENGKQICIVTHSPKTRIAPFLDRLPILKKITHWITLDTFKNKKPHPEAYISAINKFNVPLHKIIAFEDTYIGYSAISKLNINTVFINKKDYIYYDHIACCNKFENYTELLKTDMLTRRPNMDTTFINDKIDLYIGQINKLRASYNKNVYLLYNLINECKGIIYILGVGKNNHIANKCVSTWKSYGIKTNAVYVQDLFHGDFGIFTKNDYLIYISNSGNTHELVSTAKYMKTHFRNFQISICNSKNSELSKHTNIEFCLTDGGNAIQEADDINMAPSISSCCLMMFLDLVGILYAKEHKYTKEHFQLYHPGGKLGVRKPIHSVFIFAAGKGTRLKPYTNEIPKLLVNIDNNTLLYKITKYWAHYTDQFVIVIHPEYVATVDYYMKLYQYKNYKIIPVEIATQENSYTIKQAVGPEYNGKNILFTWCDIFPNEPIADDVFRQDKNIIFTHGNQCRYLASNGTIEKCKTDNIIGNIIGIYYFHNYTPLKWQQDTMDLCDCYSLNYNTFDTVNITNLIDIGDIDKYMYVIKNNSPYKTRDFNRIEELTPTLLKKEALNQKGYDIIQKEMNWYKANDGYDFIPKIDEYGDKYFIMEKLDGYDPLYTVFCNYSTEKKESILDMIMVKLDILHQKKKSVFIERNTFDFNMEYYEKIKSRLSTISPLLNCFNITHVNTIPITDKIDDILKNVNMYLYEYFCGDDKNNCDETEYNMIHGDCQFSNILYHPDTNDIKFIDPRGYYGNTMNYGRLEYDYSKVVYALSGYDMFNNNLSYINLQGTNINISMTDDGSSIKYFIDKLTHKFNIPEKVMIAMIIIHWLGLAEYNKNDVAKCVNSYYYGIYLYLTRFYQ